MRLGQLGGYVSNADNFYLALHGPAGLHGCHDVGRVHPHVFDAKLTPGKLPWCRLLVGGGALAAEGKLSVGALGFALLFVGVLHSLAIAYFVGLGGKLLDKQLQKQAATGG